MDLEYVADNLKWYVSDIGNGSGYLIMLIIYASETNFYVVKYVAEGWGWDGALIVNIVVIEIYIIEL